MTLSKNLVLRAKLRSNDFKLTEINEKNYIKFISKNLKQTLTLVNVKNNSVINNKTSDIKDDLIVNSNVFNIENNLIMNNKIFKIENDFISNDAFNVNFNVNNIINNFKMNNFVIN